MALTLDAIAPVYSTSELNAMCNSGRLLFAAAADRLAVTAASLYVDLRKVPGNAMLLGLDSSAAARKVTRHLFRAADLQAAAAVAMRDAWFAYEATYLVTKPSHGSRPRFNVKA